VRLRVSADDGQRRALSLRELQVLKMVANGGTRDVIAEQLDISPGTVASHMTRIYRALGARNAAHAVALAYGSGVLPYQAPLPVQPHLQPQPQKPPIVSRRERQVLAGLAYGLTSEQVAVYLHLSIETVKTHLRRVYRKLDVNCRANAVDRAIRGHVLAVIVYTDGVAMRPGLGLDSRLGRATV
jgi:DNA-binding CsgD family transcriptional regulator